MPIQSACQWLEMFWLFTVGLLMLKAVGHAKSLPKKMSNYHCYSMIEYDWPILCPRNHALLALQCQQDSTLFRIFVQIAGLCPAMLGPAICFCLLQCTSRLPCSRVEIFMFQSDAVLRPPWIFKRFLSCAQLSTPFPFFRGQLALRVSIRGYGDWNVKMSPHPMAFQRQVVIFFFHSFPYDRPLESPTFFVRAPWFSWSFWASLTMVLLFAGTLGSWTWRWTRFHRVQMANFSNMLHIFLSKCTLFLNATKIPQKRPFENCRLRLTEAAARLLNRALRLNAAVSLQRLWRHFSSMPARKPVVWKWVTWRLELVIGEFPNPKPLFGVRLQNEVCKTLSDDRY